ncbi:MAG: helix-turn-helix domain-containing protein [Flavobacterium sp.]|nr:helix-turn-helix domain-containing protein [Flavobacterium sp.]
MEYVDSKEAMDILRVKSKTTLSKYEKEGYIKPTRMKGTNRKRYKVSDLEKFIKGC